MTCVRDAICSKEDTIIHSPVIFIELLITLGCKPAIIATSEIACLTSSIAFRRSSLDVISLDDDNDDDDDWIMNSMVESKSSSRREIADDSITSDLYCDEFVQPPAL